MGDAFLSLSDVAAAMTERLGKPVLAHQIVYAIRLKAVPDPPRMRGRRVFREADLDKIEAAMRTKLKEGRYARQAR